MLQVKLYDFINYSWKMSIALCASVNLIIVFVEDFIAKLFLLNIKKIENKSSYNIFIKLEHMQLLL